MDNLARDLDDAYKRGTVTPLKDPVVQMRPAVTVVQRTPLENTAGWIRGLTYEGMMQMASEMHSIKSGDQIDTPEQLAKLLHSWAKATTEPTPEAGQ